MGMERKFKYRRNLNGAGNGKNKDRQPLIVQGHWWSKSLFLILLGLGPLALSFIENDGLPTNAATSGTQLHRDLQRDENLQARRYSNMRRLGSPDVSDMDMRNAIEFVAKRKAAYYKKGRSHQWPLRGIGYLSEHQNMVLTAVVPGLGRNNVLSGLNKVSIYDAQNTKRKDCDLLTVWVRVSGPEIFAGSAKSVKNHDSDYCHWEFSFDLRAAGTYKVDAKVLVWNGRSDQVDPQNMTIIHDNKVPAKSYSSHIGFPGFNMKKSAEFMCSEVCTRVSNCKYWSTPAIHYVDHEGCELYFDEKFESNVTQPFQYYFPEVGALPVDTSYVAGTLAHGVPHGNTTMRYLGCGWSFWLSSVSPCLSAEDDDSVHLQKSHFELKAPGTVKRHLVDSLCDIKVHEPTDKGRWVTKPYPSSKKCPEKVEVNLGQYSKLKYYTNMLQHIGDKPSCWYRENITSLVGKCHTGGCGMVRANSWHSSLQKQQKWYGMWQNDKCEYLELLDTELQYCIDQRQIVSIQTEGGGNSVARYIGDYIQQRLAHVKLFDAQKKQTPKDETLNVTLHVWNTTGLMTTGSRDQWRAVLENKQRPEPWEERYWVETMYITSERMPYVTAAKAEMINQDAYDALKPLGYHKISAFDMSAAWSYDSATEMDGIHIIGPPMKMIVTKLFHFLCKDHLVH